MDFKLTCEFAESVELSHNPFRRHAEVSSLLSDPEIVGDVRFVLNPNNNIYVGDETTTIVVHTISPLLGRRALKGAAKTINALNNQETRLGE